MHIFSIISCVVLAMTTSMLANQTEWSIAGKPGDGSAAAIAPIGDINSDGIADFAAGWPRGSQTPGWGGGFISLHSGRDGKHLRSLGGRQGLAAMGTALASTADYDGDQLPDLLAGAPFAHGRAPASGVATVYSTTKGTPIYHFSSSEPYSEFGSAVCGLGDTNGDDWPDLLVGAPGTDGGGIDRGALYLYSGVDGQLLARINGKYDGGRLGSAVCSLGDIDGDGRADFAAAAPGKAMIGSGFVVIYSGATFEVIREFSGLSSDGGFGLGLCTPGDLNGDGLQDLAIGEPDVGSGVVRVFSATDGKLLFELTGKNSGSRFGASIASCGDINNDGILDLVVGAPDDSTRGTSAGMASVISGANGSIIDQQFGSTQESFTLGLAGAHPWAFTPGYLVASTRGISLFRSEVPIQVVSGQNRSSASLAGISYQQQTSNQVDSWLFIYSFTSPWYCSWYYRPWYYSYRSPWWYYQDCGPWFNSGWGWWWWDSCWRCGHHYCCCSDDVYSGGGGNGGPPPPPPPEGPRKIVPNPVVSGGTSSNGGGGIGNGGSSDVTNRSLSNRSDNMSVVIIGGSNSRIRNTPPPRVGTPRPMTIPRPRSSARPVTISTPRPRPSARPVTISTPRPKPRPRPAVISPPRPKPSPHPSPRPQPKPRPRPRN